MSEEATVGGQITVERIKELRDRTGVGMAKCKQALVEANGDMEQAIVNLRKAGIASAVKKEGRATKEGAIAAFETDAALALVEVNAETDFVVNNENFQKFIGEMAQEAANTQPESTEAFLSAKYSGDAAMSVDEYRATLMQKLGENIQIRRVHTVKKPENQSFGIYSHMGGKIVSVVIIEGSDSEQELAKEIAMHVAACKPSYLNPEAVPAEILEQEKEIAREQLKGKPEHIMDKILEGKVNAYYDQHCLTNQAFVRDDKVSVSKLVADRAKEGGKELKLVGFMSWTVGE